APVNLTPLFANVRIRLVHGPERIGHRQTWSAFEIRENPLARSPGITRTKSAAVPLGSGIFIAHQFTLFSRPAQARSRSSFFRILPVAVLGSGPNSTCLGHLKWAR